MYTQVRAIIDRLKEVYEVQSKSALAAKIGVPPSSVTDAIARKSVPQWWVYKASHDTRCQVQWVKTGQGRKYIDEAVEETRAHYGLESLALAEPLIAAWKELSDDERLIVERCIDLVKHGEGDVVSGVLLALERRRTHDLKQRKARKASDPGEEGPAASG